MPRLRLLPGERELVRLRPSVGAFLPRYLAGVAFSWWGFLMAFGPGMQGVGYQTTLGAAFAGPALVGAALYLPRRRLLRFVLCIAAGAAAVVVPIAFDSDTGWRHWRTLLALTLSACGLVAVALTEMDRRLRRYSLTNLRILHPGGLWTRRAWTLHYDAILDIDERQSPLGRLLGHGTLEPVIEQAQPMKVPMPTKRRRVAVPALQKPIVPADKPRLWGVRPIAKVRRLVEAFVQDATATDYLRADQQTQKRVGQAMKELGRANVLR